MTTLAVKQLLLNKIAAVAFVDEGANLIPGIAKSKDTAGAFVVTPISKRVGSTRYQIVFAPMMIDAHGHWMSAETIEKGCHTHSAAGAPMNLMHKGEVISKDRAFIAEQYILQAPDDRFPREDHLGREVTHKGAWAQIIKVADPTLDKFTEVSLEIAAGDAFLADTTPEQMALLKSKNPLTALDASGVPTMSDTLDISKIEARLDGIDKKFEASESVQKETTSVLKALTETLKGIGKSKDDGSDDRKPEPKEFDPFALPDVSKMKRQAALNSLYADFDIDTTDAESYQKSLGTLTSEELENFTEALDEVTKEHGGAGRRSARGTRKARRDSEEEVSENDLWDQENTAAQKRLKSFNDSRMGRETTAS